MHASLMLRSQRLLFSVICTVLCGNVNPHSLSAQDPLHRRIDQTFAATEIGPVAPAVDDYTFARRVYLDLIGRIPTSQQTREFTTNPAADRRVQMVDQLLASDDFNRHMATVFDVMLMERRGGKHVKSEDFQAWLRKSFAENKPFHKLAGELIAADTSNGSNTVAAFLLERDVEPNLLTREISRTFFGMDLQCAQCHDHPNVSDYKQEDYYGIYAFVSRSSLFQPDKKKPALISEAADGQAPFKSVFTDRQAFTSPRMLGAPEIAETIYPAGDEYIVKPSKTTAGVPKYSRRNQLAELIATGENTYFRRNIANRLWALVMGRGLVHPVDMHHSSNPPSNPAVMQLLAEEIAAMNFDVKTFLRELVLTDVYQRSHRFEQPQSIETQQLAEVIRELEQQQAAKNEAAAAREQEAEQALTKLDEAVAAAEPIRVAWAKARAAATAAAGKHDTALAAEQAKKKALDQKQALVDNISAALQSTTAASQLLGNPEELAATVTALKSRSDKLNTETAKLQKELDAATKATAATGEALAQANIAEQAEREKLTPLRNTMTQHRTILVRALRETQQTYTQVSHSEQEVEFLQNLIAQQELAAKIPATSAAANAETEKRTSAATKVSASEKKMAEVTQKMTETESSQQAMQKIMSDLVRTMEDRRKVQGNLKESLTSLRTATAALPDESLKVLTSKLTTAAERVSAEVGEAQSEMDKAAQQLQQADELLKGLRERAETARREADTARQEAADAATRLTQLKQEMATLESTAGETDAAIVKQATQQFHLAAIQPLTPEQLAWSVLQLAGQIDRQVAAELAKLNKAKPLTDVQQADAAAVAQRQKEAEEAARTTLNSSVKAFVTLFGAESGQPQDAFFATVDQALFFANGSQTRSWLAPSGDNLTGRLLKLETAAQLAEELYLSALVRKPTEEEVKDVTEYLAARADKKSEAVQEMAWALVTSAEFRFHY